MLRVFFFFVGFWFLIIGFTYLILYLNLLTFGYHLSDYIRFVFSKYQTFLFFVGLLMIIMTIYVRKKE